ncbi:MAG TPA: N-6 DNA methylase, partial [Gemmatimonadaceae bacterium]|nr:N-6 DNA methylase [Gemmatimonadaceae bacterium]
MRSLESFAALVAATSSDAALSALAAELGFPTESVRLDPDTQATLGVPSAPLVRSARVATGHGALRAILLECERDTPLRTIATNVAQQCTSHAPQLLWLLIATQYNGCDLMIATWSADRSKPRVVALHVDRTHVVPSDAETVAALAAAADDSDILAYSAWLDTLGRDALTRRFYRTLEQVVANLANSATFGTAPTRVPPPERTDLALLYVSRLLFLSFIQTKGWLDHDRRFLHNTFARTMERGGNYHNRILLPLFFGTLNTPPRARAAAARAFGRIPFLNGGLFARTPLERRRPHLRFADDMLGVVFGELLSRYRFSPREESANWSEAAVDPEMLGKAFESLMEANNRRASGAFYTPRRLVATVSRAALAHALTIGTTSPDSALAALDGHMPNGDDAHRLRERCDEITILDPACGSGAFLVHILEQLASLRSQLGDPRPVWQLRRDMLTKSIFGVDINPTAVWLCELRLWLSVVIDCDAHDPMLVPPLPNLDRHIRIGDSLAGDAFDPIVRTPSRGSPRLAQLRERYARSSGRRKHTLQRALDRAERTLVVTHLERQLAASSARRRDILSALRGRDLFGTRATPASIARQRLAAERDRSRSLAASLRAVRDGGALPFAWITHFPDVARAGGFTTILGNPPWVRLHRIPADARLELRRRFTCYRNAPWSRGASAARATMGFAAQVDLAALFAERALSLLQPGGTLALLLPSKLWRALAGGGIRAQLHQHAHLVSLEDWSEAPRQFDAAVYPSLLVATRRDAIPRNDFRDEETEGVDHDISTTVHRPNRSTHWCMPYHRLALDADPASPWLLAPPPVRDAFDLLADAGIPLAHSPLGPPQLGVKCGLNEAFIVRCTNAESAIATINDGRRSGRVERSLLRPLLRGDAMAAWRPTANGTNEWILWTHDARGAPLRTLPPLAHAWLARWRSALSHRADARSRGPWWSLFRTAGAGTELARVVWADVGRTPRALVLAPNDRTVALNSCYILPCRDPRDAHTLAALLN